MMMGLATGPPRSKISWALCFPCSQVILIPYDEGLGLRGRNSSHYWVDQLGDKGSSSIKFSLYRIRSEACGAPGF